MSSPGKDETIIGTFADAHLADLAADSARKAGFHVERRSGTAIAVDTGQHAEHADDIRGLLAAYGAREYRDHRLADSATADLERTRVEEGGTTLDLVEEQLSARTRSVQTGEVTIRREVISETRTIEVPVRREELVIEHHPVDRQPVDRAGGGPTDPLVNQLMDRLRQMQPGETLRIPIIEEEVVVHKQPVVVEEITVGKRVSQETQQVSETVRREQAHIEQRGDIRVHQQQG